MESYLALKVKKSKTVRIDCKISSPKKTDVLDVVLIYDTGADKTSITRSALKALGYTQFSPSKHEKRTASGIIRPEVCTISELVIGNQFRLTNMDIDVLEVKSSPTFDGMIGMDFITQVESTMSGTKGTLVITKGDTLTPSSTFSK